MARGHTHSEMSHVRAGMVRIPQPPARAAASPSSCRQLGIPLSNDRAQPSPYLLFSQPGTPLPTDGAQSFPTVSDGSPGHPCQRMGHSRLLLPQTLGAVNNIGKLHTELGETCCIYRYQPPQALGTDEHQCHQAPTPGPYYVPNVASKGGWEEAA